MTFIKILIYKLLNKQISNIYNRRFDNFNNTPKGVFWNSKLSQDLRLNIILDKILQNTKSDEFSIADIGCGYGRLYQIIRERKLDEKVQYQGFDINQKLISFCKNNKDFENIKFSVSAFPFNKTDFVVMSGTYNLTPTNNISLWEDYIIKNLTNNLVISNKKYSAIDNQFVLDNGPINIFKLLEKINIEFLKLQFNSQSKVKVNNYIIDLNSREILIKDNIFLGEFYF